MTVPHSAVVWRKSTRSSTSGGTCVELANTRVGIRDSKNPAGPILTASWPGLVSAIQSGSLTR